ncbi:hypothetical protein [Hymenobacter sp. BT190]|uniref:hypothetical protein n=1 Tax=Hymenobacter sp. BT190 TaxID=2763505 RepID=UPI0016517D58|nr:hypothetical protein [Hymenobacter sp. BT190]MBC6698352.1 hypothetical protein [Hymenobacter sp. BT190]
MQHLYDAPVESRYSSDFIYRGTGAALAGFLPLFCLIGWLSELDLLGTAYATAVCSGSILLAAVTSYRGLTVDGKRRRYRFYWWILCFRLGSWQNLPAVTRVVVLPFAQRHTFAIDGPNYHQQPSVISHERGWKVILSVADSAIGIVVKKSSRKTATKRAIELAGILGLELQIRE